ncbi:MULTISPECIES: N-acetylmuramoyl-L-alanine amidase [Rhodobacterales]|uniref:N-acetylmuramoyl-L-alanine amidase n=1 Tax=Roseobacter sp. N2S TaxID=2663844 RepID=UPI00285DD25E|nr:MULTISPECIES: N-acetylmuramoyl-L-alanine amidase [Rhodobacterales]MDR6264602.1 N-acetylmuramoyl-L-alanine amidase [Roseobacter sp. N2S]
MNSKSKPRAILCAALCAAFCTAGIGAFFADSTPVMAQDLQALARVEMDRSTIKDGSGDAVNLKLQLSQPVPYRVFTLDNPPRIVFDFKEIDWTGFDAAKVDQSDVVTGLRFGIFRPGWSRLVLDLAFPVLPEKTEMRVDEERGTAILDVKMTSASQQDFTLRSKQREEDGWALPKATKAGEPKERQLGDRPVVVVIDPGHGGVDGGAERDGYEEKDLVLQFARELQEALIRSGRFEAKLTRAEDVFLSLPDRISVARTHGADVFISIHADALAEGSATGTTVYTLSSQASSTMAAQLAEQHDRSDLLAGVDLHQQDDQIAAVLMDMAQRETGVRSEMLADMLVNGIAQSVGRIRKRPHLSAGFTVLKAPDIPSVLVELGFMSNKSDLNNLLTERWRKQVVAGIINALDTWTVEDAAQGRLLRQ